MFCIMTSSTTTSKRGAEDPPHPTMRFNATSDYEDSASFPEAQDSAYAKPSNNNKTIDISARGKSTRASASHGRQTDEVQIRGRISERQLDLGRPPYLPTTLAPPFKPRAVSLGYMKATMASTKRSTARSASPTIGPS